MSEAADTTQLPGFDPAGEPFVRRMADGTLRLVLEFVPPSWAEDVPDRFGDFDRQLASAIGRPVLWEDRETFIIPTPAEDTVERVRSFLIRIRREHSPDPSHPR